MTRNEIERYTAWAMLKRIFLPVTLLVYLLLWLIGFWPCDHCKRWHWSHIVKYEDLGYDSVHGYHCSLGLLARDREGT